MGGATLEHNRHRSAQGQEARRKGRRKVDEGCHRSLYVQVGRLHLGLFTDVHGWVPAPPLTRPAHAETCRRPGGRATAAAPAPRRAAAPRCSAGEQAGVGRRGVRARRLLSGASQPDSMWLLAGAACSCSPTHDALILSHHQPTWLSSRSCCCRASRPSAAARAKEKRSRRCASLTGRNASAGTAVRRAGEQGGGRQRP